MAKPPETPPSRTQDAKGRADKDAGTVAGADGAETVEDARAGSKGRPPHSKS